MSIAINDVIKVTAALDMVGNAVENVYYFRMDTAPSVTDTAVMNDLAAKLEEVYTHILSYMSDAVTFLEVRGFNVTKDQPMPTVSWPTMTVGGSSSARLPWGVSGLALLRTGVRRVLGRKFFGVFTEADNDDPGVWSGALTIAMAAAAGELVGSFLGSTTLAVILPGVVDKTGAFWAFIEAVASSNPAYQRRRRRGRGS
jgi:hypothetical protein